MANAISKHLYPLQSTKGLQSASYSVLPWNNRLFPQEYYFFSERHHEKEKKTSSIIQRNMSNTPQNDQWTQAQEAHQVQNIPASWFPCLSHVFFSFFQQYI